MEVRALHLGQKINLRLLQEKLSLRPSFKDPFVVEYSNGKYVVVLKYGVVVFWGFPDGDINEFLGQLAPFITDKFNVPGEEFSEVVVNAVIDEVKENKVRLNGINAKKVALISLILGRSVALENFEDQVNKALSDFEEVIDSFAKSGRTKLSTRSLLKKVGLAMKIQYSAVNQMAMLDRPDMTWEDGGLDVFYNELAEEFEIEDRYVILNEKLKMLFRNVEFILDMLDGRRGTIMELIIIILILIEIVLAFFPVH